MLTKATPSLFFHYTPSSREKCKDIKPDKLLHLQSTFDLSEPSPIHFILRRALRRTEVM